MRKNRLFIKQHVIAFCFLFIAMIAPSYAEDQSEDLASFLWEIQYDGKPVGSLLGTVHIGTKESQIPEAARELLEKSTHIVTEIQIDFPSAKEEQMIYAQSIFAAFKPATETIAERFSPEYVERVRDALRKQRIVLLNQQDQLSNEFIVMLMMLDLGEDYHSDFGMEKLLSHYISDKPIVNLPLEEIIESLQYYVEASKPLSKTMIEAWLDNQEVLQGMNQRLVQSYEANDIQKFILTMNEMESISFQTKENEEDIAHYYQVLLFDRNDRWIEMLSPILKENVENDEVHFIAVGAFHLVGDQGLVEQLRREGFDVVPVDY